MIVKLSTTNNGKTKKEYNDATSELKLLNTLLKMLNSAIEENDKPVGSVVFRGSNIKCGTPDSEE